MGTRSVQGITLLCFIFLAASIIQSCNKEPRPTTVDISQPTLQTPPTELWRKRVVTKPPTEDELLEMRYREGVKAKGWTLARNPILLPDGDTLCVTKNLSIDTTTSEFPNEDEFAGMFKEFCMYRLLIVSPAGKIRLHKEFRWDKSAAIIPDPAGKYVALVAQSIRAPAGATQKEKSGKKIFSALDRELNIAWEFDAQSPKLRTTSFAANDRLVVWESYGSRGTKGTKYPQDLYAMNREGSVVWKYKLVDGDNYGIAKILFDQEFPITIGESGNAYFVQSDRFVYAIDLRGQLAWKKYLDYNFKSSPVLLPNGNLALVGDLKHKVEIPEFKSSNPDKKEVKRRLEIRQREILSLSGYLFVLANDGNLLADQKLPAFPNSGPVVIDETKLLLNIAGKINFRSGTNLDEIEIPSRLMCITTEGEILWDKAFDTGFIEGSIQIADQSGNGKIIMAAGDDGNLYCLNESGELLWVISGTEIDPNSLAVGADGLIYVVDGSGDLVCYQLEG